MQINGIRMLAAVMFTDMVGYTAMMQEDEQRAKSLLDRHRKVLEDLTLNHQGKIIQYFGDGTLTIFGSAVEAVLCAINIQIELQKGTNKHEQFKFISPNDHLDFICRSNIFWRGFYLQNIQEVQPIHFYDEEKWKLR